MSQKWACLDAGTLEPCGSENSTPPQGCSYPHPWNLQVLHYIEKRGFANVTEVRELKVGTLSWIGDKSNHTNLKSKELSLAKVRRTVTEDKSEKFTTWERPAVLLRKCRCSSGAERSSSRQPARKWGCGTFSLTELTLLKTSVGYEANSSPESIHRSPGLPAPWFQPCETQSIGASQAHPGFQATETVR